MNTASHCCQRWWWLIEITISTSVTNVSDVCGSVCFVPPPEACWVQAAPKGYPLFIAVLITFIFYLEFFQRANSFFLLLLLLFFWIAEGSQANLVEQPLRCCTAPTPIQIGSRLQGICMLLKRHSFLCSQCVLCIPGSCLMSVFPGARVSGWKSHTFYN